MTASHRRLLTGPLLGKRHGRTIAETGVPPLSVLEGLDVLHDLAVSLRTGLVAPVMRQFILQRSPKTLHRRIVIAVALPTHGRNQAELPQLILIVLGTLLGGFNRSTQYL